MTLSLRRKLLYSLVPPLALVASMAAGFEVWLRARHDSTAELTGVVSEWRTETWRGLTYHWDEYHPTLGWTNVAGYRGDDRIPFRLTINAQGLRAEREYAPRPPEGVPRVAVFGDSTTFGEEVDDDATVPFHLEDALAGVGAEVLNFGVHGYGLGQMVLRLEEEGFGFHPDHVVIVLLIPLDLKRDPMEEFTHPKPAFRVDGDRLVIGNTPVPEASRQPWLFEHSFAAAWLFGRPDPLPAPGEGLSDLLAITRALLARARAACASAEVPLTLALIVDGNTVDAFAREPELEAMTDRIRQVLGAAGGDVLDLVGPLVEMHRRTGGRRVEPLGHWDGAANREIAGWIAAHLARRNPKLRRP